MTDPLTTLEAEITAAGHTYVREYVFGELDTRDGDGWVVTVDGERVASGASIGAVEVGVREWWKGSREKGEGTCA